MTTLKIVVKGKYHTGNVIHQCFLSNVSPVPKMDILDDTKNVKNLLEEFNEQDAVIVVRASLGSGVNVDLDLNCRMMADGGHIKISPDKSTVSLVGDIDAQFSVDIDLDTEKQFKKAYSKSTLKFYITRLGAKKDTAEPYSFSHLMGVIKGGDWDNDDSWPTVIRFESDIFTKKTAVKAASLIKIPVKAKSKIAIAKDKLDAVKSALATGIVTRVGLSIPGGGNSFFVKQEDWQGKANFAIKGNSLVVDIDAFIQIEIDSWMRKYKAKSPFNVDLECILDVNSELHYFGEQDEAGFFTPIKAGAVSL